MSIKVTKKFDLSELTKPKEIAVEERDYEHPSGFSVKLRVELEPKMLSAIQKWAMLMAKQDDPLVFLSKGNQQEVSSEIQYTYIIGEYMVSDWGAVDGDGNKLDINGYNLLSYINAVDDDEAIAEITADLMVATSEMVSELQKHVETVKKKRSTGTSGKGKR